MKRENRNFLVALLGAVALTLNSNNAAAQTVASDNAAQEQVLQVKNHREQLWQVLDQSHANDYVPVFFSMNTSLRFSVWRVQPTKSAVCSAARCWVV